MQRLTNDYGDRVNPHTTHILFSEFRKFMFLNYMMIEESKEAEKKKEGSSDSQIPKARNGLVAPPILDNVWVYLLQTSAYKRFCEVTFGAFLDREDPLKVKNQLYGKLDLTCAYLNKYKDVLNPLDNVWYNMSDKDYDSEIKTTVHLSKYQIEQLIKHCEIYARKIVEHDDRMPTCHELYLQADEIMFYMKANNENEKTNSKIEDKKITVGSKELTVAVRYGEIKSTIEETYNGMHLVSLEQRVSDKYAVSRDSAKAWVDEYYKFLVIVGILKQDQKKEKKGKKGDSPKYVSYVASTKVQLVWMTHCEQSASARKAFKLIFEKDWPLPNVHVRPYPYF